MTKKVGACRAAKAGVAFILTLKEGHNSGAQAFLNPVSHMQLAFKSSDFNTVVSNTLCRQKKKLSTISSHAPSSVLTYPAGSHLQSVEFGKVTGAPGAGWWTRERGVLGERRRKGRRGGD